MLHHVERYDEIEALVCPGLMLKVFVAPAVYQAAERTVGKVRRGYLAGGISRKLWGNPTASRRCFMDRKALPVRNQLPQYQGKGSLSHN